MEPTRVYDAKMPAQFLARQGIDVDALAPQVDGKFLSAFIRAIKPVAAAVTKDACCGPTCCK